MSKSISLGTSIRKPYFSFVSLSFGCYGYRLVLIKSNKFQPILNSPVHRFYNFSNIKIFNVKMKILKLRIEPSEFDQRCRTLYHVRLRESQLNARRRCFIITTIAAYRLCAHKRVYVNDAVSIAPRETYKYFIMLRVRRRVVSLPTQKRFNAGYYQKTVPPPGRYRYRCESGNESKPTTYRARKRSSLRGFPESHTMEVVSGTGRLFGRAIMCGPNAIRVDLVRHFKIVLLRFFGAKRRYLTRSNPYRRNETTKVRRLIAATRRLQDLERRLHVRPTRSVLGFLGLRVSLPWAKKMWAIHKQL